MDAVLYDVDAEPAEPDQPRAAELAIFPRVSFTFHFRSPPRREREITLRPPPTREEPTKRPDVLKMAIKSLDVSPVMASQNSLYMCTSSRSAVVSFHSVTPHI
jgi:hypothetical protein